MEFKDVPKVKHVLNHFPEYKQTADLELIKAVLFPLKSIEAFCNLTDDKKLSPFSKNNVPFSFQSNFHLFQYISFNTHVLS